MWLDFLRAFQSRFCIALPHASCGAVLGWLLVSAIALLADGNAAGAQPPPVAWQPTGARITWRSLSFIVPPNMSGAANADFYEMGGLGITGTIGVCAIWIVGETPADGDLATQAQSILLANLAGIRLGVADSRGGPNLIGERRVGRSADGWRYVELNGMITEGSGGRARIMLIDRGATVIPIIAISTQSNGCVSLSSEPSPFNNTITWAALYYSLRLQDAMPSDHLRQQIVGRWENFGMLGTVAPGGQGAGALRGEAYAPNGRYSSAMLAAKEGTGQMLGSYSGDGRYVVDGDKLAIFPDAAGAPEAHLIRVVEDYEATTPLKSTVRLCKVKRDQLSPYELCLSRLAR